MITPVELWRRGKQGDRRANLVLGVRILAAIVWFVFGTVFKVFNVVPRHREIVSHVLGPEIAPLVTVLIGLAETALGLWFLSGLLPRVCAGLQTIAILSMNTLELIYARALLLAPLPMLVLNAFFLALVWYAALYCYCRNRNGSPHRR